MLHAPENDNTAKRAWKSWFLEVVDAVALGGSMLNCGVCDAKV